jgi:hypothetical protein
VPIKGRLAVKLNRVGGARQAYNDRAGHEPH